MEYRLRLWVSWSFLQNNNHRAVKKMEWIENRKIFFDFRFIPSFELPDDCCFAKSSMKPRVAVYIQWIRLIGLLSRAFANGPGDYGSIPGHFIPNTLKIVFDTSLLNTQRYKVRIKGKMEQFRGRSSAHPYTLVL